MLTTDVLYFPGTPLSFFLDHREPRKESTLYKFVMVFVSTITITHETELKLIRIVGLHIRGITFGICGAFKDTERRIRSKQNKIYFYILRLL